MCLLLETAVMLEKSGRKITLKSTLSISALPSMPLNHTTPHLPLATAATDQGLLDPFSNYPVALVDDSMEHTEQTSSTSRAKLDRKDIQIEMSTSQIRTGTSKVFTLLAKPIVVGLLLIAIYLAIRCALHSNTENLHTSCITN